MDASDTIRTFHFSVNPTPDGLLKASELHFWVHVIIGVGVAIVIYAVCTRTRARRPEFRALGKIPGCIALPIALFVAAIVIGLAYSSNWLAFYQMDVTEGKLVLHYFYPHRTVELDPDKIMRTLLQRGRHNVRLVIYITPKEYYCSAYGRRDPMQAQYKEFKRLVREHSEKE